MDRLVKTRPVRAAHAMADKLALAPLTRVSLAASHNTHPYANNTAGGRVKGDLVS